MIDSSQPINKKRLNRNEQFIYISLTFIAPLLYLFILIVLQISDLDEMSIPVNLFSNTFLNMLLIALMLLSIFSIIATHAFLIPHAMWDFFNHSPPSSKFSEKLMILVVGAEMIDICGLLLGVMWWSKYSFIPFYFILPFIVIGIFHGVYLYYRFILNFDARKNELNEKKNVNIQSTPVMEPLDPSQGIFAPIVNRLNYNEKIMLCFKPEIKNILILGISSSIFIFFSSYFTVWFLNYSFYPSNSFEINTIIIIFFVFEILSFTLLPIALIFNVISEKKAMHVITSERIIIKSLCKIRIIGYDDILNVKKFLEKIKTQTIEINFKERLNDGSYKENNTHITAPIALNLFKYLNILIEQFSKRD